MTYETKDNSGSLWVNDRKQTEKHPDRTGSAIINGQAFWVSGWLKESNGKKWLSLAFKLKDQQEQAATPANKKPRAEELDDEIPF
jgi:hypothetical protein